jgi:hypothetical protein
MHHQSCGCAPSAVMRRKSLTSVTVWLTIQSISCVPMVAVTFAKLSLVLSCSDSTVIIVTDLFVSCTGTRWHEGESCEVYDGRRRLHLDAGEGVIEIEPQTHRCPGCNGTGLVADATTATTETLSLHERQARNGGQAGEPTWQPATASHI